MKSKAKPVKGSARTKRFDVGGTVGALAGLGTLAYLMSRKKKGEAGKEGAPDAAKTLAARSAMGEDVMGEDEGKKRALDQSKDPRANYMPEDSDRKELYSDINAKRVGTKPAPRATRPAAKTATSTATNASTKTAPAEKSLGTATTPYKASNVIEAGKKAPQSKTAPIKGKPNEERESKSYPAVAAEKKKADAERRKGQGMTPYASSGREEIMRKNRFHKEAELGRGIKKGGMVKKYADGGMTSSKPEPKKAPMPAFAREAKENRERDQKVKKEQDTYDKGEKTRLKEQGSMFKSGGMTASKRGDGIAMRGKTKGKMY
jgi:hypothetical protein